jgi:hypothetical protein
MQVTLRSSEYPLADAWIFVHLVALLATCWFAGHPMQTLHQKEKFTFLLSQWRGYHNFIYFSDQKSQNFERVVTRLALAK